MIKQTKTDKKIVMLSTAMPGGIRSVVEGYQRDGLFDRWNVELIFTHDSVMVIKKLKIALKAFFRVLFLLLTKKISLLHIHQAMRGSFWRKSLYAIMGRLFGIPVILHLHGSEFKNFFYALPLFAKRLVVSQFESAKVVMVLSESWRMFVLDVAPKANVYVLPNYVETPELIPKRKAKLTINVLILGIVGERKGIYDLLPALSQALQAVPQLHLQIGGDGEVDKAKEKAHDLGLDAHAKFLGWVSGESKKELLREADIYVLPSYNEGLPVSLIEAMSWGIPVITTTVGGIPELIKDQDNGFLIEPGDRVSLQKWLEQLGQNHVLRNKIGIAGRQTILRGYSKKVVLPLLESLYAECISKCK